MMRRRFLNFLARLLRVRPIIVGSANIAIGLCGWRTRKPQVVVSLYGVQPTIKGGMTLRAWDADVVGIARAEMFAKSVSELSGLPLVDEREHQRGSE